MHGPVLPIAEASVRPSQCVDGTSTVSKRHKLGSWNLHCQLRKDI